MYRIAICSENHALNITLTKHIKNHLQNHHIAFEIQTYLQLLIFYRNHLQNTYHLLIIHTDFNMGNGISCCKFLRDFHFYQNIIIVSPSNTLMQNCFSIHPLAYLTLPINQEQLLECLLYTYYSAFYLQAISLQSKKETSKVDMHDILYIESNKTYIYIYTKYKTFSFKYTIHDISTILSFPFIRCHQSFIVNIHYITTMQRYSLIINNEFTIPISKRYSQEIRKKYQKYLDTFSIHLTLKK